MNQYTYKAAMDGNTAAAHVSYFFTEVASIFPITPSSPMAEQVDEWAASGRKNLFGQPVRVVEMQSEGGAAGTVHGSLGAGALTTTYTASQGLLLMIPNMYKIAGELLPGVFHVSARTLSAHALSIFGDHSDVMACRQTGFALLASASPQEAMDLGAVAHLSAIKGRVPFLHFFDGFRTSHEIQKIDVIKDEALAPLVDWDAIRAFRARALNPDHPCTRGTTQNPDIFFQQREASNPFHNAVPGIVQGYMDQISALTGRSYHLFDYYGAEEPRDIIIAMGSVCGAIMETVDYLNAQGGKVGMVAVRLYRPFSAEHLLAAIPPSVERIAVLDRTKEPGATGEPLYSDVCNVFYRANPDMRIVGGRYGLASKDTTPGQILSVYENLASDQPRNGFTIGIEDDVTHLSLPMLPDPDLSVPGDFACKIWGLGSDGTVGANKNSAKIVGEATDLYTQAYFVYDSKKSGGLTQSHLRFSHRPIRGSYLVTRADLVACHTPAYLRVYDMTADLKPGGTFLLNCPWTDEELECHLPASFKRGLAEKNAKLCLIDAGGIAQRLGLGGRINTVLQAAFFQLAGLLPMDQAAQLMKQAIYKTYYKKAGQKVVDLNCAAVDAGLSQLRSFPIPEHWAQAEDAPVPVRSVPTYVEKMASVMNRQQGDRLPVSAFVGMEDGSFPPGSTAYEKRGTAYQVPCWLPDHCIQCNRCSLVCPHAAIRPFLLNQEEEDKRPDTFVTLPARGKGLEKYTYRIQISPLDCTGCGSCVNCCPAQEKALKLVPLDQAREEDANWTYAVEQVQVKKDAVSAANVKSSQFAQPLFEFPGACAGCGETPYIKLLTQLFGDRMYIANASGCSTAYGGSTPSTPYTTNREGRGPAWAMSLFEDCAEYAYGMFLAAQQEREALAESVRVLAQAGIAEAQAYLDTDAAPAASDDLLDALEGAQLTGEAARAAQIVLEGRSYLARKSVWAFGGDGWAYDIGFGGLDHVLASGENINMLVLDTEVYSNTGGQSSKSTSAGAVAKFAAAGKETGKKDLGRIAMSYGYIYVAQVALGADPEQCLRAMREAEAYPGPSLIIAYCPCIEHGLKCGMGCSQQEMKRAVEAGYWHLYRYDPTRAQAGKNPFQLDSKAPTGSLEDFLRGENRYASLALRFPDRAQRLEEKACRDARARRTAYEILSHPET